MSDDDLPLWAYARNTDPQTSHDAARSLTANDLAQKELEVLWAVAIGGKRGGNWYECERRLEGRMELRQSISPRFKPLRRKGMIEAHHDDNGEPIKRPGSAARLQIVWFATPAGLALLRAAGFL